MYDLSLLIVRLVIGLGMAAHGAQKLFGWFGGGGISGTASFLESLDFRPGRFFAASSGLAEFTGGVLIALGFLGPIGAAVIVMVMIVAILAVHAKNGFFNTDNGAELPILYIAAAFLFSFVGFGAISVDAALGLTWSPLVAWLVLALAVIAAFLTFGVRRTAREPEQIWKPEQVAEPEEASEPVGGAIERTPVFQGRHARISPERVTRQPEHEARGRNKPAERSEREKHPRTELAQRSEREKHPGRGPGERETTP